MTAEMHQRGRRTLLSATFLLLILPVLMPSGRATAKEESTSSFQAAWNELAAIPSWMGYSQRNAKTRRGLLDRIARLERHGVVILHQLAAEVDRRAPNEDKALNMSSNLYVLSKIVFAVPKEDRTVMGHYPLTHQPNGSWVLDGPPPSGGGFGSLPELRAPQFKRLEKVYGLRSTYVVVAGIGALDVITSTHVGCLLEAHGINSFVQGSIVWDLNVPQSQATRAEAILREDAALRKYWIRFLKPDDPVNPQVERVETTIPVMLPYSIALEAVGPVNGLNLRRVLEAPSARGLALQYPQIVSASVTKQACLSRYIRPGSAKWHYRLGDAYKVFVQFSQDLGREDAVTTGRRYLVIDGDVIPLEK